MSDTPTPVGAGTSETPRTDAVESHYPDREWVKPIVSADFARQLERDLARVTRERDEANTNYLECAVARDDWQGQAFKMQNERDALKAENEALRKEVATTQKRFELVAETSADRGVKVSEFEDEITRLTKENYALAENLRGCQRLNADLTEDGKRLTKERDEARQDAALWKNSESNCDRLYTELDAKLSTLCTILSVPDDEALVREVERLKEDKAMLDWLERGCATLGAYYLSHPTLRSAIRAAKEATK